MLQPRQEADPHWDPTPSVPEPNFPLRSRPQQSGREVRVRVIHAAVLRRFPPYSAKLLHVMYKSPPMTLILFLAVNVVFWFVALSSFRPLFLTCTGLIVAACVDTWCNRIWPKIRSYPSNENESLFDKQDAGTSGTLIVSELSNHIAEVYVSVSYFARSLAFYRRQNPGQFCFLACCFFTFLAALGCYIPGLVLSYSGVLLLLIYPLAMNHRVWQWLSALLEPALGWLNFRSTVYMMSKPKEFVCSFFSGSEEELASFSPKLDNLVLAGTDYDQSDTEVSYADNMTVGTCGGHIPLSKGSEDSKRHSDSEDPGTPELAEFPSVSNGDSKRNTECCILSLSADGSSSTAPVDTPMTANFSSLDTDSLSNIQPYPFTGTHREGHSCISISQRYSEQPSINPDLEGEDFEILDQSELH